MFNILESYCNNVIKPIEDARNELMNKVAKGGSDFNPAEKELLDRYDILLSEKYAKLADMYEQID